MATLFEPRRTADALGDCFAFSFLFAALGTVEAEPTAHPNDKNQGEKKEFEASVTHSLGFHENYQEQKECPWEKNMCDCISLVTTTATIC
jgi:hypothetical protein